MSQERKDVLSQIKALRATRKDLQMQLREKWKKFFELKAQGK